MQAQTEREGGKQRREKEEHLLQLRRLFKIASRDSHLLRQPLPLSLSLSLYLVCRRRDATSIILKHLTHFIIMFMLIFFTTGKPHLSLGAAVIGGIFLLIMFCLMFLRFMEGLRGFDVRSFSLTPSLHETRHTVS